MSSKPLGFKKQQIYRIFAKYAYKRALITSQYIAEKKHTQERMLNRVGHYSGAKRLTHFLPLFFVYNSFLRRKQEPLATHGAAAEKKALAFPFLLIFTVSTTYP